MSVQLSPISARGFHVGTANDPYKKCWWAILAGFICTGAWLCSPLMEKPVGSVHVDTAAKGRVDAAGVEQNLDFADNPDGAPGGALDLSMDGAKRKSGDGSGSGGGDDMTSMLYQAPPEAGAAAGMAAASSPLGGAKSAPGSSLAQQLKDAGKKADASGWSEKAQSGFTAPHLAGGLSGSGSAGGGGSSASASAGGSSLFGSHNASVGFSAARGLHDDGVAESDGFKALKASAGAAAAPNLKGANEAVHAGMSQSFDGVKGKAPAPAGMGSGAMAQARVAALDAAPANLKQKPNPQLDFKKLPDPPMAAPPPASSGSSGSDNSAMIKQLVTMGATMAIGGLVGGMGGQMIMMMGMRMMMQQQATSAAASQQSTVNSRYGVTPS